MNASYTSLSRSVRGFERTEAAASAAEDPVFELIHGHGRRVGRMTYLLCREIGATKAWSSAIARASVHHDIGKLLVPYDYLLLARELDESEIAAMRRHTFLGEELIRRVMSPTSPLTALHASVCRHHHERFDGSGHPDGLSGTHIPLAARIIAVTDVFDALTSSRSYRTTGVTVEEAMKVVIDGCDRQFDPDLVEAFETVLSRGIDQFTPDVGTSNLEVTEDRRLYRIAAATVPLAHPFGF